MTTTAQTWATHRVNRRTCECPSKSRDVPNRIAHKAVFGTIAGSPDSGCTRRRFPDHHPSSTAMPTRMDNAPARPLTCSGHTACHCTFKARLSSRISACGGRTPERARKVPGRSSDGTAGPVAFHPRDTTANRGMSPDTTTDHGSPSVSCSIRFTVYVYVVAYSLPHYGYAVGCAHSRGRRRSRPV